LKKRLIFLLFFASGMSGLIYEVVWLRMLSRIMGVTTYATSTILAAFMGGLALGSFIFGKFIDKRKDQLKIYGFLQLSVAVTAMAMPFLLKASIPFYKYIYAISSQNFKLITTLRVFISFVYLLIPTTLMGGTLPVLISYIAKKKETFGGNFSLLYGFNTLGAVLGVVLSGFITIGALGEWNTVQIGVLINLIVGFAAFMLYKKKQAVEVEAYEPVIPISPYPNTLRRIVLISILISGFTALAYEVIWTRHLILFLRTSIYAFSGMLAVFLLGIGTGSLFVHKFIDRFKRPLFVFGSLELIVGVLSIVNLHLFPFFDGRFLLNLLSPIVLVFPLTFLFGMIFPIASLCYTKSINKSGSSVGLLYGFNTIGNVAGALLTGFLFISLWGSTNTIILLSFVNVGLGLILVWLEPNRARFKLSYLLVVPIAIFLLQGLDKDPFRSIIEKRISSGAKGYKIFYHKEAIESTVTSFVKDDCKWLWINGVGAAILCTETKLMIHLPMMLAKEPKEVLIICFGMGTTLKSASIYDVEVTSLELVPEVYECFKYYHDNAQAILNQQNFNLIAEDGRNFLMLSSKKYDVITVDPSPPIYSAGTVNLYTQEFFSLCKEHLTPDGIMCLWFPGGTKDENMSIMKTFYSVFPNMTVWRGPNNRGFYIIGAHKEINIDRSKIKKAFNNRKLLKDLSEYNDSCMSSSQLLNLLKWEKEEIKDITKDALIITDNFPYMEFPLWRRYSHDFVLRKLKLK
jgi:spermidine synthase